MCMMITEEKCTFVKATEEGSEYSEEFADEEVSHINLRKCVSGHCTANMVTKLDDALLSYRETIRKLQNYFASYSVLD
eukprot:TRINITY_DN9706_c0_g1_i1.p2 TRINITY_DN9706_c0_g1~~TRINITY_DN9706_c0_g1_i1.p2  ORF type:complete len:78 (+),score=11.71 TRINITY_DN9706_c0_g1_i1:240-473(+)